MNQTSKIHWGFNEFIPEDFSFIPNYRGSETLMFWINIMRENCVHKSDEITSWIRWWWSSLNKPLFAKECIDINKCWTAKYKLSQIPIVDTVLKDINIATVHQNFIGKYSIVPTQSRKSITKCHWRKYYKTSQAKQY